MSAEQVVEAPSAAPLGRVELEPITLSASQISTWRGCQRQWAFKYIERIQTESTPAQLLGTETENEQLQPYLLQGRAFQYTTPEGKARPSAEIAATSLPYLPKPMTPGLEMQRHFLMPSPTFTWSDPHLSTRRVHCGVTYQGYLDLWHADSRNFPGYEAFELAEGCTTQIPHVGDFKTTSDLKWAKGEEALLVDVQAMLYAMHALYATRAPAVDLGWIYMQTRGTRKAKRTKLRVLPDHVMEQFRAIDATGQEIAAVRREGNKGNVKPLDLPPNPDMCSAYGGCPFQSKCNLSPSQIIDASVAQVNRLLDLKPNHIGVNVNNELKEINMTQGNSGLSILDQLRAKKAAADQGVPSQAFTALQTVPVSIPASVAAPPLLSSPAPIAVPVATNQIIGVNEQGLNIYTHHESSHEYIGNAADGRRVYREKRNAVPVVAPVVVPVAAPVIVPPPAAVSNPPPIMSAPPYVPGPMPTIAALIPQPINPPESALAPAPAVGAETPKKRGRPAGSIAGAKVAPEANAGAGSVPTMQMADLDSAIAFAKAMRAGCDAFLASLGES